MNISAIKGIIFTFLFSCCLIGSTMLNCFQGEPLVQIRMESTLGEPTLQLVEVLSVNNTTVRLKFSEPVEEISGLDLSHYHIEGLSILFASLLSDHTEIQLTTDPQTETTYILSVTNVLDIQNRIVDPQTGSFLGDKAPSLVAVTIPNDGSIIRLEFDEVVTTGEYSDNFDLSLFEITIDGKPVELVSILTDGTEVAILNLNRVVQQLDTNIHISYHTSESNNVLRDTTGNKVQEFTDQIILNTSVQDTIGPKIVTVAPFFPEIIDESIVLYIKRHGCSEVVITFSEEIDIESGIFDIENASASLGERVWSEDHRTLTVTIFPLLEIKIPYRLIISHFKDVLGNEMDPDSWSFLFNIYSDIIVEALLSKVPTNPSRLNSASIQVGGTGVVAYKYSLDQTSNWDEAVETLISTPIELSNLSEGTHQVYVLGKDSQGNWQFPENATTFSWVVDVTPPIATLQDTPQNPTAATSLQITVAGTDVVAYKYRFDNAPDWDWSVSGEKPIDTLLTLDTLSDGSHELRVIGRDEAGNWQPETESTNHTWIIDTLHPIAVLQNTPTNPTVQDSANISVTGDGIVGYKFVLDPAPDWDWASVSEMDPTVSIQLTGLSEGQHTLLVIGRDTTGNWQPDTIPTTLTWVVDFSPPMAVFTNLPSDPTSVNEIHVMVSGTDVVSYKYLFDASPNWDWSAASTVSISTGIDQTTLADGSHELRAIGSDSAGNWQLTSAATVFTWSLDQTPPTVVLSNLPDSLTSSTSITITVGGTDVLAYKYLIDAAPAWDWTSALEYPVASSINLSSLTETTHEIRAIGRDALNNWQNTASSTTYTWTIDATAPTAVLSNLPGNPSAVNTAHITVGGTDVSAYKYLMDAGPTWDWASASEILVANAIDLSGLSEGSHELRVIGSDNAHNYQLGSSPTSYSWTIDQTAPIATFAATPNNPTKNNSANITVGGTDVVSYKYLIDAEPSWNFGAAIEYLVSVPIVLSGLSESSHEVRIIGKDAVGNWQSSSSATSYSWVVDQTKPILADLYALDKTHINVAFNEPMNVTDATTIAYYSVPNLTITNATLNGDNKSVTLTSLEVQTLATYTCVVDTQMKDLAGNTIGVPNSDSFVRSVIPAGGVSTWIGGGTDGWQSVSGAAAANDQRSFTWALTMVIDSTYIYVGDCNNHRVSKWDINGTSIGWIGMSGSSYTASFLNGQGVGTTAGNGDGQFNHVEGIYIDNGFLYIADADNNRLQKWTTDGGYLGWIGKGQENGFQMTSVTGVYPSSGNTDGAFNYPEEVYIATDGSILVTDAFNHRVQKWASDGTYIGWIGKGHPNAFQKTSDTGIYPSSGSGDGEFNYTFGICQDIDGNLLISDGLNHRVQKWTLSGSYIGWIGKTHTGGWAMGSGTTSGNGDGEFNYPGGVYVDANGSIYVSEFFGNRVQKWTNLGVYIGWIGNGHSSGFIAGGTAPANSNVLGAFYGPQTVQIVGGYLYVADSGNNRIQRFE